MRKILVLVDLLAVLVFVMIGRSVHSHGLNPGGLVSTAWPFVSGLGVGWLGLVSRRGDPSSLRSGFVIVISTVAIGMALRVVSGQGTAVAFVFVALAFLGAAMLGWRVASGLVRAHRPAHP
ncbi:MAG: DUF3054 domain-containing protein [Acidimicrobiales bacterium]|jgi:hypothetical protein